VTAILQFAQQYFRIDILLCRERRVQHDSARLEKDVEPASATVAAVEFLLAVGCSGVSSTSSSPLLLYCKVPRVTTVERAV
jgi:hypothetical protein